jgi:hypothetical protein
LALLQKNNQRYELIEIWMRKTKEYFANPHYIQTKLKALLSIPGEIGFVVRIGFLIGLREEELHYLHDKEIYNNELGFKCKNLHPINLDNGSTIIGTN